MSEERFCAVGRGIELCYDDFGDASDPPLLLIMGLATQMIAWHEDFCNQLAARGFHVVRFDNRDIGRSTHMGFRPSSASQLLLRRVGPQQYTLSDMADDTAGLLAELDLSPAHVVGVSMGGMIGQTLAAEHPERVRSLTSIMSTTGNRWRGQPSPGVYRYLLKPPPTDRQGFVDRATEVFGVVGSTGFEGNIDHIRDYAARSFDRGHSAAGGGRQLGAVVASGDRTAQLRNIHTPTLVIHGTVDKLIRPSGGRATAKAIPGARLKMIEGMGHDLPRGAWPQLIDAIDEHAKAADGVRKRAEARAAAGA
jgi:pimeloyl-ACP methyl ester carboxylesterase